MSAPGISVVKKGLRANAKVSDAIGLAQQASYPATVAARFALIVSILAFVVAAIALGVAVSR